MHDPSGQEPDALGLARTATYYRAPSPLARRLRRRLRAAASGSQPRALSWLADWNRFGLGFALSFLLGAGVTWIATGQPGGGSDPSLTQQMVASHVRSLMENHLTDVASTDQHTVKPWFAGRLDYSPPVSTGGAAGFTLVGGRLDYVGGRPVAALVYRVRGHLINVFVWPADRSEQGIQTGSTKGFEVAHLVRRQMNYWLVSDLNRSELANFAEALAGGST